MDDNRILHRAVRPETTILNSLKQMDDLGVKSLLVLDDKRKFNGIVSIGDIQRAIIRNQSLEDNVQSILRPNPRVGYVGISLIKAKEVMIKYKMELYPIINESNEIIECFFWEDIFPQTPVKPLKKFNLPVVIIAGGKGTRLKPLTNVLPKALIPIGSKTILEEIFDRFVLQGCNDFYISLNYKADLIEYYINSIDLSYNIHFFREDKPLGTAGSLHLLKGQFSGTFFVTNCDIIIEQDYSEILDYHKETGNDITIIAALKSYPIPYGTLETGDNGILLNLTEKPELIFKINSGMYIMETHLLVDLIENRPIDITELIEKSRMEGKNIGVFPVSEKSWRDIGTWDEYKNQLL